MKRPIFEAMLRHLQAAYPLEGCGLLAGRDSTATTLYAIDNIKRSATAYEMDPQQQVQAIIAMEERGDALLAIYHSHPAGPSRPSATDIALAFYPEALYLIVSLRSRQQPIARAFSLSGDGVTEVPLIQV